MVSSLLHGVERDLNFAFHKLMCLTDRIATQTLKDSVDLTLSQFRILMALRKHGDFVQKRIAAFHGVSEAAVSRQIDTLVQRGLIERKENSMSRREHLFVITARGVEETEKAIRVLDGAFSKIYHVLSPKTQRQLSEMLDRLTERSVEFLSQRHA